MTTIGTFTRDGDSFTGTIATLALKAKVAIKPIAKTVENAPDYRIYASGVEIGAAWSKTSEAQKPYLSIKLDDPSFAEAIYFGEHCPRIGRRLPTFLGSDLGALATPQSRDPLRYRLKILQDSDKSAYCGDYRGPLCEADTEHRDIRGNRPSLTHPDQVYQFVKRAGSVECPSESPSASLGPAVMGQSRA